jgi:hypothetical protein
MLKKPSWLSQLESPRAHPGRGFGVDRLAPLSPLPKTRFQRPDSASLRLSDDPSFERRSSQNPGCFDALPGIGHRADVVAIDLHGDRALE